VSTARPLLLAIALAACGAGSAPPAVTPPRPTATQDEPQVPSCGPPLAAPAASSGARPPRQIVEQRSNDRITSLAFAPDGRMLAAASAARTITIWDAPSRALLRTLRVPMILPPIAVEWGARADELSIGQTGSILVNVAKESVIGQFQDKYAFPGAGGKLRRLPSGSAGSWIGLATSDLAIFDEQRKVATALAWPGGQSASGYISAIDVSADGKTAVASAGSKGLLAWDLAHPANEGRAVAIDGDAIGVAIAPSGDRAFVAVRAKAGAPRVDVVDLARGQVASALTLVPEAASEGDYLTSIAIAKDGATVAAGSLHRVTAWNAQSGERRFTIDADRVVIRSRHDLAAQVQALAFSPTEPLLAVANARGDVYFLDARSGRPIGELGVEARRPNAILFSDDSKSLLALSGQYASKWSLDEARLAGAHLAPGAAAASRLPGGDFLVARAPISLTIRMPTDPPGPCPDNVNPIFLAPWRDADGLAAIPGFVTRGLELEPESPPPERAKGPLCVPRVFGVDDVHVATRRALVRFGGADGLGVVGTDDGKTIALKDSGPFNFANQLSPDGKHASASDLQKVVVWDASSGEVEATIPIVGGDMVVAIAFSPDSSRVAIASGGGVAIHAIPSGEQVWRSALTQALFSVAFTADGKDVYVGSGMGSIARVHDGQVGKVLDGTSGGGVGRLAVSPDGKLLASMHQDGGVRLWDIASGALRATLVDFDDDEWVIATPGGAFDGTDEVAQRIGWVFESPLERFGFEQFASRYRDAAVVKKRLATGEGDTVGEMRRPPSIAAAGAPEIAGAKARVRIHASSPTRVDRVMAFRDGRAIDARATCKADGDAAFDLPLTGGTNRFTFVAVDDQGLASRALAVDAQSPEAAARPDLWIVTVGVSKYPHLSAQEQLKVADDDARAIAAAFKGHAGPGRAFAAAHQITLTDENATVKGIRDALAGLSAMKQDDLAIVFLAGHGVKVARSSDMRFLTYDAHANASSIAKDAIGWKEIGERLAAARGRVLLLLDACHSGHLSQDVVVPNGALASTLAKQGRAGVLVFAAAKGRQESLEDKDHGFFTRAILDTLADTTADRDRDGRVEVSELIDSVTLRVDLRTRGRQTPWVTRREVFGDFAVAGAFAK
jgi:WD40 repeat protein